MTLNKKILLSLFAFLTSFLIVFYRSTIQKPTKTKTQSTTIYWKKRFHATLASFEGDKDDKRLANEDLDLLKKSSLEFEFNLLLGDIDLVTNARVSTRPVLNTQDGKPLSLENYHALIKTNPPTHYKPWYLVIKYWDTNKQEVNPYSYIADFFSNIQRIDRPFLPHITIATIKSIKDPELFLTGLLEANAKFTNYLKSRKKPMEIRFAKENLYISKSYNNNPRFIVANTIKSSSKAFRTIEKAVNFIKNSEK